MEPSHLKSAQVQQGYKCNDCGRQFNEVSGTPMASLNWVWQMLRIGQSRVSFFAASLGLTTLNSLPDSFHQLAIVARERSGSPSFLTEAIPGPGLRLFAHLGH